MSVFWHTLQFRLYHEPGSAAEQAFLADALVLNQIPELEKFERLAQVCPDNKFSFVFWMRFADRDAYYRYRDNPIHVAFVKDRWAKEVEEALVADFEPL
jgi:hypothetical protein